MTDDPEQKWRKSLVKDLRRLDAIPCENVAKPGTQDVNYNHGWIELKVLPDWPARSDTVVRIDKLTPQQRVRNRLRWEAGGAAWIFIKIGSDHILFRGCDAKVLGTLTKAEMIGLSVRYWKGRVNVRELETILLSRQPCD